MQATVGRTVHFFTLDPAKQFNGQGSGPYAAVVTQCHPGSAYSNLTIFPPFEAPYFVGSVAESTAAGEQYQWWEWPPRA